jgi:hypothetical protein
MTSLRTDLCFHDVWLQILIDLPVLLTGPDVSRLSTSLEVIPLHALDRGRYYRYIPNSRYDFLITSPPSKFPANS